MHEFRSHRRFGALPPEGASSAPKRVVTPLSAFYGYPAATVAAWCGVSERTAKNWKSGRTKPPRTALRLFLLHRDGKVLGRGWRDFTVQGDYLVDAAGRRVRVTQLAAWSEILAWAAGLAAENPETQRKYFELLELIAANG